MGSLGSGLASQLCALDEVTYGVAPSLTGAPFVDFKSETMEAKKVPVQGIGIHAGRLHPRSVRRVVTNWTASGGTVMDLPTQSLNKWLFRMLGSYGQANTALAQDTVATTVASGSDSGEISTIASWSAPSAGVLSVASTTGFTTSGTISVAASGATTAIVTYTGKTSNTFTGCAYVSGSATGTVSTGGAVTAAYGAYKAIHYPGAMEGHSFSLQKGVPAVDGTVLPYTGVGFKVSEWEIGVKTGEIASLTLTMEGRNVLGGAGNGDPLNVSVPSLVTYSGQPGGVFHFAQASVYTGGTPSTTSNVTTVSGATLAANVKAASVKYTIPYDTERYFAGQAGFKGEPLQNALRMIAGQFDVEFLSSQAVDAAYNADTPTCLQLNFVGSVIGTGTDVATLDILIPGIRFEGEQPKVGGPEVVVQSVPFTGLDDDANNPIQVTYWTPDSA